MQSVAWTPQATFDDELSQRGPMYAALCIAIVIQHAYLFTFNYVPALRMPFSGALAAMHVALACVTLLVRPATWNVALVLSAALFVFSLIPTHFFGLGEVRGFDGAEALRKLLLPLMLIWLLSYPLALPRRLIWWVVVIGTLLCAIVAFTGPTVYMGHGGTDPRLAAFTGGDQHIHPSAKYVALQLVLIDLMRRARLMAPRLAWPLLGLSTILLLGYGGRNQMVFVAVYFITLLYFRLRSVAAIKWSPPVVLGLAVTAAVVALEVGSGTSSWGSGRIGVWQYRLELLQARDLLTLVFGGGIGADMIWTPQWWFFEEGASAHNDYLHFLMEHGLFGLLFLGAMVGGIWLRVFEEGKAVVVAVLVNSVFSNGFFQTPLLVTNLGLTLAVSILAGLHRRGMLKGAGEPRAGDR